MLLPGSCRGAGAATANASLYQVGRSCRPTLAALPVCKPSMPPSYSSIGPAGAAASGPAGATATVSLVRKPAGFAAVQRQWSAHMSRRVRVARQPSSASANCGRGACRSGTLCHG
jgi:hypothetical protein